jgi:putative pyrroloquinoline-quinone binding quinoprotein
VRLRRLLLSLAALGLAASAAACGSTDSPSTAERPLPASPPAPTGPAGDWSRFGYDAARSNDAPRGPSNAAVGRLAAHRVELPGTVDSSPIYLGSVRVAGHDRPLLVMTTTYGRTIALDPATGAILWRFTPKSYGSLAGSPQITTATPVADPDRKFVYAASPDGRIHKLRLADGSEVRSGGWPATITRDPTHEKIAAALNLFRGNVLVTTGGYIGDAPPYQGKVVAIDRATGRLVHVFNSLCSNRRQIIVPASCPASGSAIWGRGGAVVDPKSGRIYVATGNAPFNGRTNWGDSVLELGPGAARLRRHFTPTNESALTRTDGDLASASPALLPNPGGRAPRYVLQGGKDGKLRLLRISTSLFGVGGAAGARLGGQVQTLPTPGRTDMFTAPAVLRQQSSTLAFVATEGGTAAYRLRGGRLDAVWRNDTAGTSPVIAGKLLWVYDPGGGLNVYAATTGKLIKSLPAPPGHWNSPIVAGARAYLPSGDANDHDTTGALTIYAPG